MGKASQSKRERREQLITSSGYEKKSINWFPVVVSVFAMVVIVAVGVLVVFANSKAGEPTIAPSSEITVPADIYTTIDDETGGIMLGTGDNLLEEYLDFGCPYCSLYQETYGEIVREALADGKITLSIHPLALLNSQFQGTMFSTRSANSLYCVAEQAPNAIITYMDNLYANQPQEGSAGLTDEELVAIAKLSDASTAEGCILDETYSAFVDEKSREMRSNAWLLGTPTIRWNGEVTDPTNLPELLGSN